MSIAVDFGMSIVSSLIYDVLKASTKSTKEIVLNDQIKDAIKKIIETIDSGVFYEYISLASTQQKIVDFIRIVSFNEYTSTHGIPQKITRNEFVDVMVNNSFDYIGDNKMCNMSEAQIRKFFNELLLLIETSLVNELPPNLIAIPYFINNSIDQLVARIQEKLYVTPQVDIDSFRDAREEYINAVNTVFKKIHVPGFEKLELSKFHITPSFSYFTNNTLNDVLMHESELEIIDWKNIFELSNLITIIGGPGYGKTIFLKSLALNYSLLNIIGSENLIPIYCNLKDFLDAQKKHKNYSIEDFLVSSMTTYTGLDNEFINKKFLKYYIESGQCLILLDALDEVDSLVRDKLAVMVLSFFEKINKNNRICITTRDRSLIPDTPIVLKINSVNEDDIKSYLNQIIQIDKFDQEDSDIFIDHCRPLIKANFLTNFLMVTLMIRIFKAERKLPENKIDLYDKCITYIAIDREKEKAVSRNFDNIHTLINSDATFEHIASLCRRNNNECFHDEIVKTLTNLFSQRYMDINSTHVAIEQFLQFCCDRTEVFVQGVKEKHYKFFHRSFFEFFYAKHLLKNSSGNVKLYNELVKFSDDSEMLEITVSYLKKDNYKRYMELGDVIFSKSIKNKNYLMLFQFVALSDEYSHINKIYDIFFSNDFKETIKQTSRGLMPIEDMKEVIIKLFKFEDFFDRVMSFYKNELLDSIILDWVLTSNELKLSHYNLRFYGYRDINFFVFLVYKEKKDTSVTSLNKFISQFNLNELKLSFKKQVTVLSDDRKEVDQEIFEEIIQPEINRFKEHFLS
jgi:hypothetical protein